MHFENIDADNAPTAEIRSWYRSRKEMLAEIVRKQTRTTSATKELCLEKEAKVFKGKKKRYRLRCVHTKIKNALSEIVLAMKLSSRFHLWESRAGCTKCPEKH